MLTTEDTENTEAATPETDAAERMAFAQEYMVPTEWAEQLEGERDEAMKTLTDIHRWIERNHPDGFIDSLTFFQNLERVADRWYERLERVEREREEARELAQQMSESNQVLMADVRFYRNAWEQLKEAAE
jgi:hypothetical protein